MHDAVGILIPKLHLRNSELFPSYSESWMLQKQRERKEIFWTRWSLQSLTTQTILWLSVTELSNFTPLLHINLEKKLQLHHSQTYLTRELCFSVMSISCFSTCALHSRHKTGPHTCTQGTGAAAWALLLLPRETEQALEELRTGCESSTPGSSSQDHRWGLEVVTPPFTGCLLWRTGQPGN